MELCQRGKLKQFPMTKSGHFKQKKKQKKCVCSCKSAASGKKEVAGAGHPVFVPGGGVWVPCSVSFSTYNSRIGNLSRDFRGKRLRGTGKQLKLLSVKETELRVILIFSVFPKVQQLT